MTYGVLHCFLAIVPSALYTPPSCIAGSEFKIVILSTVRSQPAKDIANEEVVQADRQWMLENLGFITDEHQICVGITRSRLGLVIVGEFYTHIALAKYSVKLH